MFRTKFVLLIIVVALVGTGLVWWWLAPKYPEPSLQNDEADFQFAPGPAPNPTPALTPTPTPAPATKPKTSPGAVPEHIPSLPVKTSITTLSPGQNDKWISGEINKIQWSKEAGITGGIYLVNTSDNAVVGWITQSTNVHQTYYEWNTRDVFLSRTNPFKKTVERGQYVIKAVFDGGKPQFEIVSAPFSIIYPSEVQISTYALTIKNYAFNTAALTVKKGSKLIFANSDSVTHKILLSSFSPMSIEPGDSFTFDTSVLTEGSYNFYSETYPTLKLTVTVQ